MSGLTRKKIKVRSKSGKTYQRSMLVRATNAVKRHGGKVYQRSMMVRSSGKMSATEFTRRHGAKFLLGGVATGSAGIAGMAAGWRAGTSLPVSRSKQAAVGGTLGIAGGFAAHWFAARALLRGARHSQMQKDWANSTPSAKLAASALYLGGVVGSAAAGRRIFEYSENHRRRRGIG